MKFLFFPLLFLMGCVTTGTPYLNDRNNQRVVINYPFEHRTPEAIRAVCGEKALACMYPGWNGEWYLYAPDPKSLDDDFTNCVLGHEFYAHAIRGKSHAKGYIGTCGKSYYQ